MRCFCWQNEVPGLWGVLSEGLADEKPSKHLIGKENQEEIVTKILCSGRFIPQVLRNTLS